MRRSDFTKLIDERDYKLGAEIGVAWGAFSVQLLQNSRLELLLCVDTWAQKARRRRCRQPWGTEANMKAAIAALRPYGARKLIIRKPGLWVANWLSELDLQLDFVYLDASHAYQDIAADIEAWWPRIRSGGILAGHDYDKHDMRGCKGVIRAVDEFVKKEKVKFFLTVGDRPKLNESWWVSK